MAANMEILQSIEDMLSNAIREQELVRPVVTVSYAQSLDGSIAIHPGKPLQISGDASLRITHGLRARHDAILVGIGTVLSDDPRLTVRLQEGRNPIPVIVDSELRMPTRCNLLQYNKPIIAVTERADSSAVEDLRSRGVDVLLLASSADGQVNLVELLQVLFERKIRSVMVEGGPRVLTSFFREGLVDLVVLTIAPQILGGVPALLELTVAAGRKVPRINQFNQAAVGEDLVVWGTMDRSES